MGFCVCVRDIYRVRRKVRKIKQVAQSRGNYEMLREGAWNEGKQEREKQCNTDRKGGRDEHHTEGR